MISSRSWRRTRSAVVNRRGWLARTLAGAAYASFAAAGCAPNGAVAGQRGARSKSPPPAKPEVLASLLQRNHELRPDFGGGFSNHVSMGLYSLRALGADEGQLERFAAASWSRLEPLPAEPGPAFEERDWKSRLGQRDAINGYRALFTRAIARHGRDATLRKYLPDLLPGIGCAGFHALIRTGYGVRFGDEREVADGLAYWATAFASLGALGPIGAERDPRALFESVHATPALANQGLQGHLISGKMKSASQLPGFEAKVSAFAPSDTTVASLAAATVRLYAQRGDFTCLHAVTGTHAFRLLQPFITTPELGLRYLWQAMLAAYVSVGAPRVLTPPVGEVPAWSEIVGRARASLDEHDVKLVEVAREQGAFYSDPFYRRAAARRVELLQGG